MQNPIFGTGVGTPAGKSDAAKAASSALHIRNAISHLIPRDKIIQDLLSGVGSPLATWLGPGWGTWYDNNLKPDTYDVNLAVTELQAAGYTVNVAPLSPIVLSGTPILGQSLTVSGASQLSHELVVIEQSDDGGKTWKPIAASVADNSSKYVAPVPGPPLFGSTLYAANFTGYAAINETMARKPLTPALVNQYIRNGLTSGNRQLIAQKLSAPISASSTMNDTLIILTPIMLMGLGIFLGKRRKRMANIATQNAAD